MTRQDDAFPADLACHVKTFDGFRDSLGVEFARRPGGQHGHAFGVRHDQPGGQAAAFDFVCDGEVGDAEVGCDQHRAFGGGRVDLVDARRYLDRFLRIGVDVLAQDEQRIEHLWREGIQHHEARVFGDGLRGVDRFFLDAVLRGEEDGRITERAQVGFDRQPSNLCGTRQGFAHVFAAQIKNHIIHALGLDFLGQVGERVNVETLHCNVSTVDDQRGFVFLGSIRQGFIVG